MKIVFILCFFIFVQAEELLKPITNSISYDKQKADLGEFLFFDKILSKDKTISCASCHEPEHGWADDEALSYGVKGKVGVVNSPTILNSVFNFRQFWNGRVKTLKEQASGPIHRSFEMDMSDDLVEKRVNSSDKYKKLFKNIYNKNSIKYDDVVDAIAEFEKRLITPDSKFDLYLKNKVKLSKDEKKGYLLFKTFGCITCHNGLNLGGNSFQKLGIVIPYTQCAEDRYEITKREFDRCVYKVPTLRNVVLTSPYFHDGSAKDLKTAIKKMSYHNLGFEIDDKDTIYIEKFLNTLTGKMPKYKKVTK